MSFLYVNSVFSQRWYGINVKDYSISAQRWYRIELNVLIVVISDKDLRVVLLEGTKEDELSCDSERKKTVAWESVLSLKNCLKSKVIEDFDPIKENRAVRDSFEKCLLCTLYQVEFILSSFKVVISHTCLIWPTSDEACVSWNIQIYFWIWFEPVLTFISGKRMKQYPHDGVKLT